MPKMRSCASGFGGVEPQINTENKIGKANEIIKENRIHFRWKKKKTVAPTFQFNYFFRNNTIYNFKNLSGLDY